MNRNIQELWDEAEATGEPIEVGELVVCDRCSEDFTNRDDQGGFIFSSSAYCPPCALQSLPSIRGYGEEHYIRAHCPEGVSFADFVRQYRQSVGSTAIQIRTVGS